MKKEKIDLLVTFDKNYIEPFKVMLKSLSITNPEEPFHIWLLHSEVPYDNRIVKWFFKSGSSSVCFYLGYYERFTGSNFSLYFSANSGLFHLAYKLYRWR